MGKRESGRGSSETPTAQAPPGTGRRRHGPRAKVMRGRVHVYVFRSITADEAEALGRELLECAASLREERGRATGEESRDTAGTVVPPRVVEP